MPEKEFKKVFQLLASKCSKKELSTNEALQYIAKFNLKLVEKHRLINQLKKDNYINHERYASAFTHDRFNFYKWGKLKIKYHLLQKGIEEDYVDNALDAIDYSKYKSLIEEEANKKHLSMGSPKDFNSKQKLSKYLNQKGFEGELIFEIVENL